jgi:hypothetical protein
MTTHLCRSQQTAYDGIHISNMLEGVCEPVQRVVAIQNGVRAI